MTIDPQPPAATLALAQALAEEMLRSGRTELRVPDPVLAKCIQDYLEAASFDPET